MTDCKPIRLLASDLDGTLYDDLQHPGQISAMNQAAIRRWTEAGNRFLIATGRRACTKQEIFKNYQIDCDILACNGAKVIVDKEVVSKSFPRYWEALAGCFGTKSGYSDS